MFPLNSLGSSCLCHASLPKKYGDNMTQIWKCDKFKNKIKHGYNVAYN